MIDAGCAADRLRVKISPKKKCPALAGRSTGLIDYYGSYMIDSLTRVYT